MKRTLVIILIAIACIGLATIAFASKRVPAARPDQLAGVWVGWADDLHYFRLELSTNGTGLCGFIEVPHTNAWLCRISVWTLKGYDMALTLKPIDREAWGMTMKGNATASHLQLKVSDDRFNGWRSDLVLRRETFIEGVTESTKQRMKSHEPKDR
jgi:hypothetical protein